MLSGERQPPWNTARRSALLCLAESFVQVVLELLEFVDGGGTHPGPLGMCGVLGDLQQLVLPAGTTTNATGSLLITSMVSFKSKET